MKNLNEFLAEKKKEENKLQKEVIEILKGEMVDYTENKEQITFFNNLLNHGCESGIIGSLIYYKDTIEFYNKHCKEIIEYLNDIMFIGGYDSLYQMIPRLDKTESLNSDYNKNYLVWFTFESIAFDLLNEYDIQE